MRTTYITKQEDIERKWFVVDASGHTLGRLASEIATILRGKNKPIFSPNTDVGDNVIVINADKIKVTGKKLDQKVYRRHTGYTGGLKETSLRNMIMTKPENVLYLAVKGMLPKNVMGRQTLSKLHIFAGPEHKHQAQKPEALTIRY